MDLAQDDDAKCELSLRTSYKNLKLNGVLRCLKWEVELGRVHKPKSRGPVLSNRRNVGENINQNRSRLIARQRRQLHSHIKVHIYSVTHSF